MKQEKKKNKRRNAATDETQTSNSEQKVCLFFSSLFWFCLFSFSYRVWGGVRGTWLLLRQGLALHDGKVQPHRFNGPLLTPRFSNIRNEQIYQKALDSKQ